MSTSIDVAALATAYAEKSPQDVLKLAFDLFGDDLWISFSGAEDVVLLDMAWKLNKSVKVFTLDTGRLHSETYRFIEQVRDHYGIAIEIMTPDPALLQPLVNERACSVSTATVMANAAVSARSSRCAANCRQCAPGPPASGVTRALAPVARLQYWNWIPRSRHRTTRCTSSTRWHR